MTNWTVKATVHTAWINEYIYDGIVAIDDCEISFPSSLLHMFSWYTIGSSTRGWDMVSHTCAVLMTKTSKIFTVFAFRRILLAYAHTYFVVPIHL